jgi:hypothetical protein
LEVSLFIEMRAEKFDGRDLDALIHSGIERDSVSVPFDRLTGRLTEGLIYASELAAHHGAAPLQQRRVEPHPVALGNTLPNPNRAKAAGPVQSQAGLIMGKDSGLESPDPGSL